MKADSQRWFWLSLLLVLGWLMYLLAPVITPFAAAAALAYLGDPLVDRLEQRGIRSWKMGRTLAVVVVFLIMIAAFTVLLLIIVPLLAGQVRLLVERFPDYVEWASQTAWPWIAGQVGLDTGVLDTERITGLLKSYWKELSSAAFTLVETLGRGGQAIIHWVTNLVLIPVVTFYLLRDWDLLVRGLHDLMPRHVVADAVRLAGEIDEVLGAFVRGQLIVMVALGVIYTVGLWLVGIDLAFLIGMGAGLLSIVPYLGSIVGLAVAAGAALFQFHDLLHLVLVLAVFTGGQMAEGMLLTPKLVGDRIGLHPVAVIFAVLAGGQLFGLLGILLALPAAAALNVVVRHARQRYQSSSLYRLKDSADSEP